MAAFCAKLSVMAHDYEIKVIDHLGLVAGMFDELDIGAEIDQHISQDSDERIISVSDVAK
jgi:hypothetical protein